MFIWTTKFTRKKAVLLVLLAGLLLALCILLVSHAARKGGGSGGEILRAAASNEERLACLSGCGWQVEESPVTTLDLVLPEKLEGEDLAYNRLQQSQGLDLSPYCGRQVCRYTYRVLNYPGIESGVQANLYVCDGQVIAGDIFYPGENGFMAPLAYPK